MSDVIVKNHIYDFMRSNNVSEAQQAINTADATEVNNLLNTFDAISAAFTYGQIGELSGSSIINPLYKGGMLYWNGTTNINLSVSQTLNIPNFTVSVVQLSSGTITITKVNSYNCELISYGDLFETAGKGSVASIISIPADRYLITGILQ
jgi:hypothetical protein